MDNTTKLAQKISYLVRNGFLTEAREVAAGQKSWSAEDSNEILAAGMALEEFGVTNGYMLAMSVLGWLSHKVEVQYAA